MQFVEFKKSLHNKIEPVYIICGKELYLIENALNNLLQACNVTLPEMNISYIDDTTPLDEIFVLCQTLPFCSNMRLVIVKDYSFDDKNNSSIKQIEEYLENANTSTCLVFTSTKLVESKKIVCVNCDSIPTNMLASKIVADLNKKGFQIQTQALNKLIENVQGSITSAYSELNKLIALSSNEKIITIEHIDKISSKTNIEYSIFQLSDAIAKKDATTATKLLKSLINADNAKGVISYLYNYFRRLFLSIASKNATNEQIADILGVKPYSISIAKQQAKAIGANKIMQSLAMLEKIDTQTKTTFANLEQELYLFLFYTLS